MKHSRLVEQEPTASGKSPSGQWTLYTCFFCFFFFGFFFSADLQTLAFFGGADPLAQCILKRISHTIYWKSPISILGLDLDIPIENKDKLFANSGDPDQTIWSAASDLGLHCLPITRLGVSRLQWVNSSHTRLSFCFTSYWQSHSSSVVMMQSKNLS